jgi:hypothetical protein
MPEAFQLSEDLLVEHRGPLAQLAEGLPPSLQAELNRTVGAPPPGNAGREIRIRGVANGWIVSQAEGPIAVATEAETLARVLKDWAEGWSG